MSSISSSEDCRTEQQAFVITETVTLLNIVSNYGVLTDST